MWARWSRGARGTAPPAGSWRTAGWAWPARRPPSGGTCPTRSPPAPTTPSSTPASSPPTGSTSARSTTCPRVARRSAPERDRASRCHWRSCAAAPGSTPSSGPARTSAVRWPRARSRRCGEPTAWSARGTARPSTWTAGSSGEGRRRRRRSGWRCATRRAGHSAGCPTGTSRSDLPELTPTYAAPVRRAVAGVVAVLALAGCGSSDADADARSSSAPASSSAAPALPDVPGIEAEAVQQRTDVAIGGQVQVRITDTGTAPFTVTSVQLDSPGFAPLPAKSLEAAYAPGRTIDLTTQFGAVDCSTGVEPVGARVTVLRPDGGTEELLLPLAGDTMARIHDADCRIEAVLRVVGITVQDLVDAGQTLTADVVLTRQSGAEPVEVSRLSPSVVLDLVPDDDLPVTLAAGDDELRIPVTFDAARCDPHALAETKQPFLFPLLVTVGDSEDVPVPLPLDDGQRRQLQELLDRLCVN